jgi:hypothetical protein
VLNDHEHIRLIFLPNIIQFSNIIDSFYLVIYWCTTEVYWPKSKFRTFTWQSNSRVFETNKKINKLQYSFQLRKTSRSQVLHNRTIEHYAFDILGPFFLFALLQNMQFLFTRDLARSTVTDTTQAQWFAVIPRQIIATFLPFNAGIKSLRATLDDEIFYWEFCFLNRAFR